MNPVQYILDSLVSYCEPEGDGSGRWRLDGGKLLKPIPGHEIEVGTQIIEGDLDPYEGTLSLGFEGGKRVCIRIYAEGALR